MPMAKTTNRGEKNGKGKLAEKSSSFHGRVPVVSTTMIPSPGSIRRPKTLPDLFSGKDVSPISPEVKPKPRLTKLLLNVTIQGGIGPIQVVMSLEFTVGDLIAASVRQYVKEGRRPILCSADPSAFDLHYSQFSLESIEREQKLVELGSRNLYVCARKIENGEVTSTSPSLSCSREVVKATRTTGFPWLKFMGF